MTTDRNGPNEAVRLALTSARLLIRTPDQLCHGVVAVDARGEECDATSPTAARRSAYGALLATGASEATIAAAGQALQAAAQRLHGLTFVQADDRLTHPQLLALFDAALGNGAAATRSDPQLPLGAAAATPGPQAATKAPTPDPATTTAPPTTTAERPMSPLPPAAAAPQLPEVVERKLYTDVPSVLKALAAFDRARDKYNLCIPVRDVDFIPPGYAVSFRPVAVDARLDAQGDPIGADVYRDDRKPDQYGLSKIGLEKITTAAGVSWETERLDDAHDPLFCHVRKRGTFPTLDGRDVSAEDSAVLDLRDGTPQARARSTARLTQQRVHIHRTCESLAQNAVARRVGFIKGLYGRGDIQKPFVVASLVFTGATDDPVMKQEFARAIADRATGARRALAGPRADTDRHPAPPPPATTEAGGSTDPDDPFRS